MWSETSRQNTTTLAAGAQGLAFSDAAPDCRIRVRLRSASVRAGVFHLLSEKGLNLNDHAGSLETQGFELSLAPPCYFGLIPVSDGYGSPLH